MSCEAKTTLHQRWGGGQICSFWAQWLHGSRFKIVLKCLNSFVWGCSRKESTCTAVVYVKVLVPCLSPTL